jgi:CheY-like chemotaxis protein
LVDRILVVDDEPDLLNLAKLTLERKGYMVTTASQGEEALRKVEAEMPDLVLLDIVMPGKTGLEVCKVLKAERRTRHIPLVMFTALGRDVDRKLAKEAGCDGYVIKPFTLEGLLSEVRRHIERGRKGKFSEQLGVEHDKLKEKILLLEFDPSIPYERLVRDFALECAADSGSVIVLTKRGSAVRQALEGEKNVELLEATLDLVLSPLLQRNPQEPLGLVYDSLTELALSTSFQNAYKFTQSAIRLLSQPRIAALFLLNPTAHDAKETQSFRGLFSSQASYEKQGVTGVRIT